MRRKPPARNSMISLSLDSVRAIKSNGLGVQNLGDQIIAAPLSHFSAAQRLVWPFRPPGCFPAHIGQTTLTYPVFQISWDTTRNLPYGAQFDTGLQRAKPIIKEVPQVEI
jgi:hypothetical protein